jgi:hypothetical protein
MPTTFYKCPNCGKVSTDKTQVLQGACQCRDSLEGSFLPLAKKCSEFYALSFLTLEKPTEFKSKFQDFSSKLAEEFLDYTVKVTGGESRHFKSTESNRQHIKTLPEPMQNFLTTYHGGMRKTTCTEWLKLKSQYSNAQLLEFSKNVFDFCEFPGGYGGSSWANICRVALQFAKGETTPVIFVDCCWGLHHNGQVFLDKDYQIPHCLSILLESGRSENIEPIYQVLSNSSDQTHKELAAQLKPYVKIKEQPTIIEDIVPWQVGSTVWVPFVHLVNPKKVIVEKISGSNVYFKLKQSSYFLKATDYRKVIATKPKLIRRKKTQLKLPPITPSGEACFKALLKPLTSGETFTQTFTTQYFDTETIKGETNGVTTPIYNPTITTVSGHLSSASKQLQALQAIG